VEAARGTVVSGEPDDVSEEGWVDFDVAEEFPGLRLHTVQVDGGTGRSPRALKARLRMLSDRFHGAQAITMRNAPVPHAYRVFFRGIGLDPDSTRTPIEAAALERLRRGGFQARNLIADALLIALVETGVPVWAVDAARLDGPLGLRTARIAERLGEGDLAPDLPEGRLVVADATRPVAELFGDIAPSHEPSSDTTRLRLFAIQVSGVPAIHVEEALWLAVTALRSA
jgi:DNA/RNA-binding domain of Phe-tRNA-synthetase-like protein